jgi:beta-RFAP synthase
MSAIRVRAPARLHLGLLDLGRQGRRRFGGVGVAVEQPEVVVEASAAGELSAAGPESERALRYARRAQDALDLPPGAALRVAETIPAHVGLGSGTKLALTVGAALAALHGRDVEPERLATAVGRGGRSAVGLWTFVHGGLVVEGGVAAGGPGPGPLLARHPLPEEWRCVLVGPPGDPGLSGHAEEQAFREVSIRPGHAAEMAQTVLTRVLPAVAERDLAAFGEAVTHLQRLAGEPFEPVQGGLFHPQAAPLVDALLRFGAAGAGQSSWGPTVYGIVGSEAEGRDLARRIAGVAAPQAVVRVVAFDNRGAQVEVPCASL